MKNRAVSTGRLLDIVETLGEIATGELSHDAAMQLIVNRVGPLIGADGAAIALLEGGDLVFRAGQGVDPRVTGWRYPVWGSLGGRSLEEERVLLATDAARDPRVHREVCRRLHAGSLVCAPLSSQGNAIGVLTGFTHRTDGFDPDDVRALEMIVGALAAHLQRAWDYSRVAHLCLHDHLTGLGNRRSYEARLAAECARAERNGTELALCLLDLDGFKRVNDRFGHTAGDEVLRAVGDGLLRSRTSDDAFRIGGDEFALLFEGCDAGEARGATDRLIGLMDFSDLAIRGVSFGISYGVASDRRDPAVLHGAADQALLEAKARLRSLA